MSRTAPEIEAEIARKVETLKLRARGLWWTMRHLAEQNGDGNPGDLLSKAAPSRPGPMGAEELAVHANASAKLVLASLDQVIAKGLVKVLSDGTYHLPHVARLYEIRQKQRARVSRHRVAATKVLSNASGALRNTQCREKALRNTPMALRNTLEGVTSHRCNTPMSERGSPPVSLSPTPPIPITPLSENSPDAAHPVRAGIATASGDAAEDGIAMVPRMPKTAKFLPGVWRRAMDGWHAAYEHVHQIKYKGNSRQWKALSDILTYLDGDLSEFEKIVKAWLREPEIGISKGHELTALLTNLNYIRSKIAKGMVGHADSKQHERANGRTINDGLTLE